MINSSSVGSRHRRVNCRGSGSYGTRMGGNGRCHVRIAAGSGTAGAGGTRTARIIGTALSVGVQKVTDHARTGRVPETIKKNDFCRQQFFNPQMIAPIIVSGDSNFP